MQKVYYYPSASRLGYDNPYSINYKRELSKYYHVFDGLNKPSKMLTLSFFFYSLYADVFFINWLECAPFLKLGRIQYRLACFALSIIKLRKKKIVWMLHNIHPHSGSNVQSEHLQGRLFAESSLVVCHSRDAFLFAESKAKGKCLFFNHPVQLMQCSKINVAQKFSIDVFIWGNILPYKGIYEFLSNQEIRKSNLKIHVLGFCKDPQLTMQIQSCCSDRICFDNRRANFDELCTVMRSCRYVLFPYVGNCVSSSGALIDTLVLGGIPVGPNVGAFYDLSKQGVCLTYGDYSELLQILKSDRTLSQESRDSFLKENSWESFVQQVISYL